MAHREQRGHFYSCLFMYLGDIVIIFSSIALHHQCIADRHIKRSIFVDLLFIKENLQIY